MTSVVFSEFSVHVRGRHDVEILCAPFTSEWNAGAKGLTIGLMGRSGIGKTCFVKALVGLPDGETRCFGSITINGLSPVTSRSRGKIGMAFQQPGIVPWLSVRENIAISGKAGRNTVDQLLEWLDLSKVSEEHAGTCSGGQQSRISFARSLAHKPPLLILDEPFTGVDIVTKKKIFDCIAKHGVFADKLVVLVTHDVHEIARLAEQLWVLSEDTGTRKLQKVAEKANAPADWTPEKLEALAIAHLV